MAGTSQKHSPATPVTIETALTLPALQRGDPVVRSGRSSLDRVIRWAHAAEVPNIAQLLQGGELLLTTGIGIGKREQEQRRFVRALAEREIAGLILELGQVFSDVPEPFVSEAQRYELPLITLQREIPFVQVTEAIHREILQRQYAYLETGTRIHDRFSEIVLGGGDLGEVMRALARTVRNPVLLENEERELLSHAEFRTPESKALAGWRTLGGEAAGSGTGEAYVLPVPMGSRSGHGRLVTLPLDGPVTDLDRVVLERVVWLIALTLMRTNQEVELSLRTRGSFLLDLIDGRVDEEAAAATARSLGFDHDGRLVPAVVRVGGTGSHPDVPRLVEIASDLRAELESCHIRQVAGLRPADSEILVVVSCPSREQRPRLAEQLATTAHRLVARRSPGAHAIVAVGRSGGWTDMPDSLRETCEAAEAAVEMEPRTWHDAAEPDMERLLWQLRGSPPLKSFVHAELGPLIEHDAGRKNKLLPTLEALCRQGGNKAEAARELFLARQALYNRLRRINEILGFDVTSPEHFPAANLAVRAVRYVEPDGRHQG